MKTRLKEYASLKKVNRQRVAKLNTRKKKLQYSQTNM